MSEGFEFEQLINEMITLQQAKVLKYGCEIVPGLTEDDLLQPNDFPALEHHPVFRYEEGLLAGLLAVRMAMRASSG